MPSESSMFKCDVCGKNYHSEEDAENCERSHDWQKYVRELENAQVFIVIEDHLKLIRNMNVGWNDMEFGAPTIDPKRPYFNSDVIKDILLILGDRIPEDEDEEEEFINGMYDKIRRFHREMQVALQIVLETGRFEPGKYAKEDYEWKKVE